MIFYKHAYDRALWQLWTTLNVLVQTVTPCKVQHIDRHCRRPIRWRRRTKTTELGHNSGVRAQKNSSVVSGLTTVYMFINNCCRRSRIDVRPTAIRWMLSTARPRWRLHHGRLQIGANWVSWPPWKNGWNIKNAKKTAVSHAYVIFWEQSGQARVENGAMLTT